MWIKLASTEFDISKNQRAVDLLWGSNLGPAILSYEIERSLDGVLFEQLLTKENEYADLATHFYQDVDNNPEEGWNYYRLKRVMIDGSFEYSEAKRVHFLAGLEPILLFPNPTIDEVQLYMKSFVGLEVQVEIYDNLGQIVRYAQFEEAPGTPVELNIRGLQAGTYHVVVKSDTRKTVTSRLVLLRD